MSVYDKNWRNQWVSSVSEEILLDHARALSDLLEDIEINGRGELTDDELDDLEDEADLFANELLKRSRAISKRLP
jgi:hypothetical protein